MRERVRYAATVSKYVIIHFGIPSEHDWEHNAEHAVEALRKGLAKYYDETVVVVDDEPIQGHPLTAIEVMIVDADELYGPRRGKTLIKEVVHEGKQIMARLFHVRPYDITVDVFEDTL